MTERDPHDRPHVQEWARIINPEDLKLGEPVGIDDFVLLYASNRTEIGDRSVIHSGSRIVGSGELVIGQNVAVTYNCVLVTEYPLPISHMSTMIPKKHKDTVRGRITIHDEAFIGSGSIIMPEVTIGEGAVIAAQSYVDEDIPPWTIRYPNGRTEKRDIFSPYTPE